jgi:hypothetical protein
MSSTGDEPSGRELLHQSRKGQCKFLSLSEPFATQILASDIHIVNLEAKAELLSQVVPFSPEYKDAAKQIQGYFQGVTEGALKDVFTLKSDDISQIPLRLLNPTMKAGKDCGISSELDGLEKFHRQYCRFGKVSLEKEVMPSELGSYVTASYCWLKPAGGDIVQGSLIAKKSPLESPKEPVETENTSYPLPFSPLLYHAILNERKTPREGVWIDQVCINQSSSSEKAIAVNAMDLIYKCARTVVILLDDIEVSVAEQEFLADYILEFEAYDGGGGYSEPHYQERPSFMKANPVLRNFFLKFISAKWFERAWCMHEMRLSQQHVFLIRCEANSPSTKGMKPLPTVLRFTDIFMVHLLGLAFPADLKHPRLRPLLSVFGDSLITSLGFSRGIPSYMRVFADVFRQSAAGNPAIEDPVRREHDANLDKLSIALNTIGIGLGVTRAIPISTSEEQNEGESGNDKLPPATNDECCRRFTILAIASADPSALCCKGPELQLGSGARTWMHWPLFDDIGSSSNDMSRLRRFDIELDPSANAAYFGLDMCFYNGDGEGSRAGGVRWASERKLTICRAFKDACELRKIASPRYNLIYGKSLERLQIRKAVIRTIAAVMECGADWLLHMTLHVLGENWNTQLLLQAVQRLLGHEKAAAVKGAEADAAFDAAYLDSQPGRREAEQLLDLARYLIDKGLPWSYETSLAAYEAVCLVGDDGATRTDTDGAGGRRSRALMFARVPGAGSNVDVVCATPAVLLHDEYCELFRGWSLVKGRPGRVRDGAGVEKWKFHLLGKSAVFGMVSGSERGSAVDTEGSGLDGCGFGKVVKDVRMYGPDDEWTA